MWRACEQIDKISDVWFKVLQLFRLFIDIIYLFIYLFINHMCLGARMIYRCFTIGAFALPVISHFNT